MSHFLSAGARSIRAVVIGVLACAFGVASADAQETVAISVPPGINFEVADISRSTAGTPGSTRVTFSDAVLDPGKALRVSVQADAAAFTPPSGMSIPAEKVSWTMLGANGGLGSNGTLSSSAYTLVFQSDPNPSSGHIDLAWSLAAPGTGIRAGTHQLMMRWKVESIVP